MSETFLTPEVLEEEHTARSYLSWVRGLVAEVQAEPNGLRRLRLREGLAKELMNEALPIGLLASTYFEASADVRIKLKVGNQNFDAEVFDQRKNPSEASFIEVTLAHEGEDQYLRACVLNDVGEVSALGSVTKRGTKKTGLSIDVEHEMVSQEDVLRRERNVVVNAIERKLAKTYPSNTLLLIGFDDTMAFDRPDNIQNLTDALAEYLPNLEAFCEVVIVGLECGLCLHWRLGNAI